MSNGLFFTETPDALGRSRDVGFGNQPGDPGTDGIGIVRIEQIPNTYELPVTLTDGRALQFPLPAGPEGDPGVTPEFVNGEVVFGALGSAPRVVMRRLGIGLFAIDVQIPDYTIAVTAASNAKASEDAAAASKTAAAGSATAAAASAVQAAQKSALATSAAADAIAAYDNFDDRYLGPKASDPALDNDGNALLVGTLYYNTGAQPGMRVRKPDNTWDKGYAVITGGVQSFNGRDGAVTPQTGDYGVANITGLNDALSAKINVSAKATQAQALAGADDSVYMTPLRVRDTVKTAAGAVGDVITTYADLGTGYIRTDGATYLQSAYPALFAAVGHRFAAYSAPQLGTILGTSTRPDSIGGMAKNPAGTILVAAHLGSPAYASLWSTSDGVTWNMRLEQGTPNNTSMQDVTWDPFYNVFVAVMGVVQQVNYYFTSPDGITWTMRYHNYTAGYSIACGNGVCISRANSTTMFSRKADAHTTGSSWTQVAAPAVFNTSSAIFAFGNNRFVAVQVDAPNVANSADNGLTWTLRAKPTTNSWSNTKIKFINGIFWLWSYVANDNVWKLWYSVDGDAWTESVGAFTSGVKINTVYNMTWTGYEYLINAYVDPTNANDGQSVAYRFFRCVDPTTEAFSMSDMGYGTNHLLNAGSYGPIEFLNGKIAYLSAAGGATQGYHTRLTDPATQFRAPKTGGAGKPRTFLKAV